MSWIWSRFGDVHKVGRSQWTLSDVCSVTLNAIYNFGLQRIFFRMILVQESVKLNKLKLNLKSGK
jgi:hypothetical protein